MKIKLRFKKENLHNQINCIFTYRMFWHKLKAAALAFV